jgi:hypothetical protein
LSLNPLMFREEAVSQENSPESSSRESKQKLVVNFLDNNCTPSVPRTVDLSLPQQPILLPEHQESSTQSTERNVIPLGN